MSRLSTLTVPMLVVLVSSMQVSGAEKPKKQSTRPPQPVALLQGLDTATGGGLSTAVSGQAVSTGGTSTVKFRVALDELQLAQSLEVNESASAGLLGFGSVDEKAQFVKNQNLTTYSLSVVVHAKHLDQIKTATDVQLRHPQNDSGSVDAFVSAYGDSYVSQITTGGEYDAVYTFYTESKEEQSKLSASLSGAGLIDGLSIDASVQTQLTDFLASTNVRRNFDQRVSGLRNPKLPADERIIPYATDFTSIGMDSPKIIKIETTGYEHVPGVTGFDAITQNRTYLEARTAELLRVSQLKSQIEHIKSVYTAFDGYVDKKLDDVERQAVIDLGAFTDEIAGYEHHPTQLLQHGHAWSLDAGGPSLKYKIWTTNRCGGDGGSPFQDVDYQNAIPKKIRLIAIQFGSGRWIDKVISTYQAADQPAFQVPHGKDGDHLSETLWFGEDAVARYDWRCGQFVDAIKITTASGRSISAGGDQDGGPYTTFPPAGSFLLGYEGRSGVYVDQLAPVVGSFSPATWQ